MPELISNEARVLVLPELGGRVSSLVIDDTEVVVGPLRPDGTPHSPFGWGVYPMVPFAGRIRGARFSFAGVTHRLPERATPHAIHGTVDDVEWEVAGVDSTTLVLTTDLGADWPFSGRVTHTIGVRDGSIRFELALEAIDAMPAQVGWHPWFVRPARIDHRFSEWMPRDADGMPGEATREKMPSLADAVDDCFVSDGSPVTVRVDNLELSLSSDCSHWVVYTGAEHGICVEPQSGPPNAIESAPDILAPGETLRRWFEISWSA